MTAIHRATGTSAGDLAMCIELRIEVKVSSYKMIGCSSYSQWAYGSSTCWIVVKSSSSTWSASYVEIDVLFVRKGSRCNSFKHAVRLVLCASYLQSTWPEKYMEKAILQLVMRTIGPRQWSYLRDSIQAADEDVKHGSN